MASGDAKEYKLTGGRPVMLNFMCQLPGGHVGPDSWLNIILVVCLKSLSG